MPIHHHRPARAGCEPVAAWQRQRLGHTDRLRIMEAARRRERETYRRGSGRHGGELRETALRVLWTLLYRGQGRAGACDPSLQQIAEAARLARSTVQEALARLRAAGILSWMQRGAVVGRRWTQVTSAYLFAAPAAWREARPVSDTGARSALESEVRTRVLWEGSTAPAVSADRLAGLLEAVGWSKGAAWTS